MRSVGIVAVSTRDEVWSGGKYYLQHVIRCASSLGPPNEVKLRDVWWGGQPADDPFKDVREILGPSVVVAPPKELFPRVVRKMRRVAKAQSGARDLFDREGIDVFFPIPPCENSGTPYVFWMPDFQYLRRPDLMSEDIRQSLERYYALHARAAAQVVLSSDDARTDLERAFPDLVPRAHVVKFCSVPDAEWWRLDPKAVASGSGLPERFFIVCNQFTRHKNHLGLMAALKALRDRGRNDVHLVCTGSTFDFRNEDCIGQVKRFLERNELTGQVHILGLVPRATQIALLRRAIAVLQPSLFEGWSTIIEDAKSLGKPVLASDLPVHVEQLGRDHPYLLSPDNVRVWADAMEEAWSRFDVGPDLARESSAQTRLESAKQECGVAFVRAMRAALSSSDLSE